MKPISIRRFQGSFNSSTLALVTAITAFASAGAHAATFAWNGNAVGNDSNWATDTNWTGTPPDDANVVGSHRLNVNGAAALTYSTAQGTSVFASLADRGLVVGSGTSGTMNITGGSFSTLGAVAQDVIGNGNNSTGILNISAGAYIGTNAGTLLGLGGGAGRVSTLNLSGSGTATLSSLILNSRTIDVNLNGGTLELNSFVNQFIEVTAKIRFNGGTLKARQSSPTFISNSSLLETLVQAGGAIIDTNTFDLTIAEPLLEDATSTGGGLTKKSSGLLTLGAPNTLTGPVAIEAGGLGVKGGATSWAPSSFTHSGNTLNFDLGIYSEYNPVVIETGALTVDSAITVNVTGSAFLVGDIPLIQYASKDFTGGSLTLNPATLPPNVSATLEDDNNGLIFLKVTSAPTNYVWSGDTETPGTGDWDTSSSNWNEFTAAFSTSGTQIVQFPDIPVALAGDFHTVNLTATVSPIDISITNASANPYILGGPGKITGATTISKSGTGTVTFTSAHDYTGATTISGGALIKQAADATTGNIIVTADNRTFVLSGGITDGAGQTLFIAGRGDTGGNYFFPGSAVQRGALQAHNGASTWQGDVVLTSNTATPNLNRIGVQSGASLTLTGSITENVTGAGLVFRAAGLGDNITLGSVGTYSYTGLTELFSGGASIILGAANKLPVAGIVNLNSGGFTVFDLNGFNQEVAGYGGSAVGVAATITNNGGSPSILTVSPPLATAPYYQGIIANGTGGMSVVKKGSGTQTLAGPNTYAGNTTVEDGTLSFIQSNFADTSTVTIGTAEASPAILNISNPGTDIVASLIIDGVSQPGNGLVYDSVNSGGAITGAGKIQVGTAPAGGYSAWATANNVLLGENGDDDNDGLINLVEYALGLNPQASSVPAGTFVENLLTFTKGPEAKAALDVTYQIETSTTLDAGSWTPAAATDTTNTISFQLPPNHPGGRLFARLKVIKP